MCNTVFLNWGCFFELFLNDLDEKVTSADYERHKKENKETSLSPDNYHNNYSQLFACKTKIQLNFE